MLSRDPKVQGIYLPSHYRILDYYVRNVCVLQLFISFFYLSSQFL